MNKKRTTVMFGVTHTVVIICFYFFISSPLYSFTISDSSTVNKSRLKTVFIANSLFYTGSMVVLNEAWYSSYPRSRFHFFNDNDEWKGMDKVGHIFSSYALNRASFSMFKWAGLNRKEALYSGAGLTFLYLTSIEVLDGFSSEWGFSVGDFGSNLLGIASFSSQELLWQEQRVSLKFSARKTSFSAYRPELLGYTFPERVLKDYNGQTYWLSTNVASFLKPSTLFPKWLNVAVGYGANGMTGGKENPRFIDGLGNEVQFDRTAQVYVSLDVDLSRISVKSKVLQGVLNSLNYLKFPFPALEFSKRGLSANWLSY